jgi:hypothetical protein
MSAIEPKRFFASKTDCTSIASNSPCLTSYCFIEISECYTIFRMMNACPCFLVPVLRYGGGSVGQARIWKLLGILTLLGGRKLADV